MFGRWLISSPSNRVVARCSRNLFWRARKSIAGESSKKYRVSCSEYRELNLPGSCSLLLGSCSQTQNRRPDRFFRPAASIFELLLCLNDSRRDEENQLLVGGVDHRVLEQ